MEYLKIPLVLPKSYSLTTFTIQGTNIKLRYEKYKLNNCISIPANYNQL